MWPQVQINKQAVALPYKKYGLQVYESGINFVVDIPELGALISYNGLAFAIRLPYRLFGNNTKGQCGELPPPGSGLRALPGGGRGAESGRECPPAQRGSPAPLLGDPWAQGLGDPKAAGGVWHPPPSGHSAGALPCVVLGLARVAGGSPALGAEGSARASRRRRHVHQQHGGRLRAAQRRDRL